MVLVPAGLEPFYAVEMAPSSNYVLTMAGTSTSRYICRCVPDECLRSATLHYGIR